MAPPTRRRGTARTGEESEQKSKEIDGDYFKQTSSSWYTLILVAMTLYWLICYRPYVIPYKSLGPIGQLLFFLKENHAKTLETGFKVMILVHTVEAFVCYRLCRQMKFTMKTTLKWTFQTILVGFASFGTLLKYNREWQKIQKDKES